MLGPFPPSPPLALSVDARDAERGVFHVVERVPVSGATLSLYYPKWIPGEHQPSGPLNSVVRFVPKAGGKTLPWRRDSIDPFRIDVTVPEGTKEATLQFDELSDGGAHLARVKWNRLVWYPRIGGSDEVTVRAELTVPARWSVQSALELDRREGDRFAYKPVSLTRLIDSPAQIGRYAAAYDVTGRSTARHTLDVMAESEEGTKADPELLASVTHLHEEVEAATGSRHYGHYDWLLTLSDQGGNEGLEHHESSEDGNSGKPLSDAGQRLDLGDLLSHEYFHSFNGKFRRPAGLATPEFETPMRDDLLWVYEGLTQYYGYLLAARAGFWTPEQYRERLAADYDDMQGQVGREWRPVGDTATAASVLRNPGASGARARRGQDYYVEMVFVWLEAEGILRSATGGAKGLDDFLKAFYGGPANGPELRTYERADVVAALNAVAPYDWEGFFATRVDGVQPKLTAAGLEVAGWRMVYTETPNAYSTALGALWSYTPLPASVGLALNGATISDVTPGSAADRAGLAAGATILTVGDRPFSTDALVTALGKVGSIPMVVQRKGVARTVTYESAAPLRYPHLEQIPGKPDRLADLIRPRRAP